MIKFVFTIRRRPDMSREEFQKYWFENHGALIKRHAETLHIRRYVQTHARDTSTCFRESLIHDSTLE